MYTNYAYYRALNEVKEMDVLYEVGKRKSELTREYGVSYANVNNWIKKYRTIVTSIDEVTNNDEIIKLKKKLHEAELENEIPKKVAVIFWEKKKIKSNL